MVGFSTSAESLAHFQAHAAPNLTHQLVFAPLLIHLLAPILIYDDKLWVRIVFITTVFW